MSCVGIKQPQDRYIDNLESEDEEDEDEINQPS